MNGKLWADIEVHLATDNMKQVILDMLEQEGPRKTLDFMEGEGLGESELRVFDAAWQEWKRGIREKIAAARKEKE